MIRQQFNVEDFWEVIVWYDTDISLFSDVVRDLQNTEATADSIYEIFKMLFFKRAKAATFSNTKMHISVVVLNPHKSKKDFINSIVHEAEHVKQAMLNAYDVEDKGEPPAYTIGYLISQMYKVFGKMMCA